MAEHRYIKDGLAEKCQRRHTFPFFPASLSTHDTQTYGQAELQTKFGRLRQQTAGMSRAKCG
jgi:hypothetical protein